MTIAISVIFSAFNALTLSPALSALLAAAAQADARSARLVLRSVQSRLRRATDGYVNWSRLAIRRACSARVARRLRGARRTVWLAACQSASCRKKTKATSIVALLA